MKRQNSLPKSSQRENATEKLQAKAVGCMSGFFHFISSNYHSRTKLLTFGKKQQKTKPSSSSSSSSSSLVVKEDQRKVSAGNDAVRRFSCDVQRSPTLRAEIRRSDPASSPRSLRSSAAAPPALLARLMGLEEAPTTPAKESPLPEEYSSAEKRRELLGALEKCDRDLQALKKIIDAVNATKQTEATPPKARRSAAMMIRSSGDHGGAGKRSRRVEGLEVGHADQPASPVSVLLDELMASSKRLSFSQGKMQPQVMKLQKKKPGEEDLTNQRSVFDLMTYESLRRRPIINTNIAHNEEFSQIYCPSSPPLPKQRCSNKGMKASVEQVCKDIAWGEKREVGKIGLALQDHIFRDLIEEIVIDLLGNYSFQFSSMNVNSLPFEACKRRLCF